MMENFSDYGYLGVFVALLASGFGFPIPEELPVLSAGVLVGHGDTTLRWWVMLPVCIAGVVIGDGILYSAGRIWGPRILATPWVRRKVLSEEKQAAIEKNFHDRGVIILLTARLTPGIRTPIFLMAGVLRVPVARFLIADGLYAIPGVNILFWLAYFLTDQVLEVFNKIDAHRPLIVVGLLSGVGGIIVYHLFFTRKVSTGSSKEVPLYNKPVEKVTEAMEHAVEKAVEKAVEVVTHRSHVEKPHPLAEIAKPPPEPSPNGAAKAPAETRTPEPG